MDTLTNQLASFVTQIQFNDVPEDVIYETKRLLLDSIGCAIGGLSMERGRIARDLATRLGGRPESTIFGTNSKVSCDNAAFANGELINVLDSDAICGGHVTPYVLPSPFAMAESVQASGKELLLAIALSHEIGRRLDAGGQPMYSIIPEGPERGAFKWPSVYGYSAYTIGAAVGAGKIMNLSQEKMANTIGIAGYICPPNTATKWEHTAPVRMIKYGACGWGAKAGVTAALLADEGYVGDTDLFEGDYGFWRYTGSEQWDQEKVVKDLGQRWVCRELIYKQYPSGL